MSAAPAIGVKMPVEAWTPAVTASTAAAARATSTAAATAKAPTAASTASNRWHRGAAANTLGAALAAQAAGSAAHRDAVVAAHSAQRWTFQELRGHADAAAAALLAAGRLGASGEGVAQKEGGGVLLAGIDNTAEALVLSLAAARVGAALHAVGGAALTAPKKKKSEQKGAQAQSQENAHPSAQAVVAAAKATGARLLVCDLARLPGGWEALAAAEDGGLVEMAQGHPDGAGLPYPCAAAPALRGIMHIGQLPQRGGVTTLRDALGPDVHPQHDWVQRYAVPAVDPEDACGPALGGLTQRRAAAAAAERAQALRLAPGDRVLTAGSVVAPWAQLNAVWPSIHAGAMLLIPAKDSDRVAHVSPRGILRTLFNESATHMVTTAEHLNAIAEHAGGEAIRAAARGKTLRTLAIVPDGNKPAGTPAAGILEDLGGVDLVQLD